jgi:hypothetical protein
MLRESQNPIGAVEAALQLVQYCHLTVVIPSQLVLLPFFWQHQGRDEPIRA